MGTTHAAGGQSAYGRPPVTAPRDVWRPQTRATRRGACRSRSARSGDDDRARHPPTRADEAAVLVAGGGVCTGPWPSRRPSTWARCRRSTSGASRATRGPACARAPRGGRLRPPHRAHGGGRQAGLRRSHRGGGDTCPTGAAGRPDVRRTRRRARDPGARRRGGARAAAAHRALRSSQRVLGAPALPARAHNGRARVRRGQRGQRDGRHSRGRSARPVRRSGQRRARRAPPRARR